MFLTHYVANLGSLLRGRQPVRPLLFSYYVTHRCPRRCVYCSDGGGRPFSEDRVEELSTDDAKRLISILRRSADTLDVTGGEPLVREDLEEILRHAKTVGFRTVLNTKGMGLSRRPDLWRWTDVLILSVDALEVGALSDILGGSTAEAEAVLRTLDETVRSRSSSTRIVLSAVALPDNLIEVEKVLDYAMEHGFAFQVSPQIVGTRVAESLKSNPRYRRLMDRVLEAKRRAVGVLGVPSYLRGIRDFTPFHCHPLLMPVVRPDGGMYYPCLESKKTPVNILESGSFEEALALAEEACGEVPSCRGRCHIFCHMALSLLQRNPLSAFREGRHWKGAPPVPLPS